MSRADQHRAATKRRIVAAARASLSGGGGLTEHMVADICEQVGVHPHAFRQFYPTDDELLDAVHDILVDECAERLRGSVARFRPTDGALRFAEAATALADAWPLDRGGMIIRAERRLQALRRNADGRMVTAAERRYLQALTDVLVAMMATLRRQFRWAPALAVRVILDTYERSFEAWILEGGDEATFATSPYIKRTLPTLLEELSAPVG
jgi:AcrR family transcriptional regulator